MGYFDNQPIAVQSVTHQVDGVRVSALEELLAASAASDGFKAAVKRYLNGETAEQIRVVHDGPPVKVMRAIMKLLETMPKHPIERVAVEAQSGCATYTGELVVWPGPRRFSFSWDCAWRARKHGMKSSWGGYDQQRAAQLFDYQCFREFEALPESGGVDSMPPAAEPDADM